MFTNIVFNANLETEDDSIIKPRFFTAEGSWMIVSQSGIGKSSLVMQMGVAATLQRDFFGLEFARPMRVMLVQAENNRLDLVEPCKGIAAGLDLSDDEIQTVSRNLTIISQDRACPTTPKALT